MKTKLTRISAFMLALIMTFSIISCGDGISDPAEDANDTKNTDITDVADEDTTVDPFADTDYEGREFRISTSINTNDSTNANHLIAGTGELTGEAVNDAVFTRNQTVEELLGVKLVFTETNYDYGAVASNIRNLIMAGDDAFDVIINDLFPFCDLTFEGMFLNVNDSKIIDFDQNYWYKGYMESLKLTGDRTYLLAGDFFMDIISSAHALFYNKDMFNNIYGNPDIIYDHVLKGDWTLDTMTAYVNELYNDLNGDSTVNEDDQFGYACIGMWGSMIPFVVGADINFTSRSADGTIEGFDYNNERSVNLLERMVSLFYSEGTISSISSWSAQGLIDFFANGNVAFVGYQRLGSLEKMRDITFEIGIVPYPKYDENQKNYVTSSHDTTEIGAIPMTCGDLDFVSTVLEVLNRETGRIVIPQYYENALKMKYTRDQISAQMIDIIHDNFGSTFPIGYGNALNGILLATSFSTPLTNKSTDFVSNYTKVEKSLNKAWSTKFAQFIENSY